MGRGRGKGKKQSVVASHEDPASGKEEKVPPSKRRGRPQKPAKDDIEGEEVEKIEENSNDANGSLSSKDAKDKADKKRPRENINAEKEENGIESKASSDEPLKSVGFRQIGSRRKNKPRRAAEVGVKCR